MRCERCGAPALAEDARFCVGCGGPLSQASAEAAPTVTETPRPAKPIARRKQPRAVAPPSVAASTSSSATVPMPVVIGGVVVLLVILLVLLLSA